MFPPCFCCFNQSPSSSSVCDVQLSGETAVSQAEAEHPNPAVNTVMKAMRTLGGDPSKLDVEGALQTMFNL